MTLCIAAECEHDGEPALILCADMQGTDFAKSDDIYKLRLIRGIPPSVMFAGDVAAATELISLLGPVLRPYFENDHEPENFDIWANGILADLRKFAQTRLAELKREFVLRNYGLTLGEFYAAAKDLGADAVLEVRRVNLGCDLLIAHVEEEAMIFAIREDGEVRWETNYACIGSGSTIARAILCQESWATDMTLMDCAVRVISAKRASEKDPYVGNGTNMVAVRRDELRRNFSKEAQRFLSNQRLKIKWPYGIEFKESYFDESDLSGVDEESEGSVGGDEPLAD